jgi:putative ABC transport system permease protein
MKVLNKKLLRDLRKSWAQSLAICAVVVCGTASYICLNSAHRNLLLTRDTYYSQYRFAEFEIMLERAPQNAVFKVESLDGVREARGRIVEDVNLDLEGVDDPRMGRLISMPDREEAVLNDICIMSGRYFTEGVQNEVILSKRFAEANHLNVGDSIKANIYNRKHTLRIVGTALSPEYIYLIRNIQEITPAPERFGVLWVPEEFAETALDMDGAYNNIVGTVESLDQIDLVLDQAEELLDPYGVFAKMERDDQVSHRFLADEIAGLEVSSRITPTVFMSIAALILLILLNRIVRKERTEIGLLKAYGYSNFAVGGHYLKFAMILGVFGGVVGFLVGQWLADGMMKIYVQFYDFPLLRSRIYSDILARSLGLALLSTVLGATAGARRAARIHPAESMRPEAPRFGHRVLLERVPAVWKRLSFTWKMIVRNVGRNRFRAALNVLGVMISTGLLLMGYYSIDAIRFIIRYQYEEVQREDIKLSFILERGRGAYHEVSRLDHVLHAEPVLQYPFTVSNGWREKDVVIIGLPRHARLQKLVDTELRPVDIGEEGLVISEKLGRTLDAQVGSVLTLEPLMGRIEKEKQVRVSRIVQQYMGTGAYMNIDALSRILDQSFAMNAALLRAEPGRASAINAALKDVPAIAAVEIKEDSRRNLEETLAASMKIMNTMVILFSGVIAFAVIYNITSVSLAERERELASLRVLGFSRGEVGRILYNENFLMTAFGILVGIPFGLGLVALLVWAYDTDLYRMPFYIEPISYWRAAGLTILFVLLANLAVRRRIARLDMVEVLKERE